MIPKQHRPAVEVLAADRAAARRRRRRRWFHAALAVVALWILVGFFVLPPIAKGQAVKHLEEALGDRAVAIEKIRINPLTLSVTVEGLDIRDAEGGRFAGWRRLHVNFDSFSVFTGELRFQDIELDGLFARVERDAEGGFNFDDLLEKSGDPEPEPDERDGDAARPLQIGRLAVTDARVEFDDASRAEPFATQVGPLAFTLTRFKTAGDANAPYAFEAVTEAGERVAWKGTLSAMPVRSTGELAVTGVQLGKYAPYYADLVSGEIRDGVLDIGGHYELDLGGETPRFRLTDGLVMLTRLTLAEPGVEEPLVTLDRFTIGDIEADLETRTATIGRIALEGGSAHVRREADGTINVLAALQPEGAGDAGGGTAPGATATNAAEALPDVRIGEVTVSAFAASFEDHTTPRVAVNRMERLDFTARDLQLKNLAHELPFNVSIALPDDGEIEVTGSATAQPLRVAAKVEIRRVALPVVSPYLESAANARIATGQVSVEGSVLLVDGGVTFTGQAAVNDFSALDPVLEENLVRWTSLTVNGINFTSEPLAVSVGEIVWTEPAADVIVAADGALNLARVMTGAEGAEAGAGSDSNANEAPEAGVVTDAATGVAPKIAVDRFELRDAAFRFEDRSIEPAARVGLREFGGTLTGLSSEAVARAKVDLRGKVDGVAPISVSGQLDPLGDPAMIDVTLDLKGVDLQPLAGPYVGKFAGYALDRGALNLDIVFKLNGTKLDAKNRVVLEDFTLGSPTGSPDATKLPVRLGIALLKDASGKIVIDPDIRGDLSDPEFKIKRMMMRVVTNMLAKAATSPFSLLASAVGGVTGAGGDTASGEGAGDGEELAFQRFAPGSAELLESEIQKLNTIAKALVARPALKVHLQGNYGEEDIPALRRKRVEDNLRVAVWEKRRAEDPATPALEDVVIGEEELREQLVFQYSTFFPGAMVTEANVVPSAPVSEVSTPDEAEPVVEERVVFRRHRWVRRSTSSETETEASAPAARAESSEVAVADEAGAESPEVSAPTVEEMLNQLAQLMPVGSMPQGLAEDRAVAVREWLIGPGGVAAERVLPVEREEAGDARAAERPAESRRLPPPRREPRVYLQLL